MFLEVVIPILVLLLIGLISREAGVLTSNRVKILNKVAFYIALPALVFHSIYSRSLREIFSFPLVLGFCTVILLTLGIGWVVFRKTENNPKKSVAITQSYHGNLGYMGLPVVAMALGDAAGAKASLLLGVGSTIQIPLTTTLLVHLNRSSAKLTDRMKRVGLNPVLLALIVGLVFSCLNIPLPQAPDKVISLISKTALPIALLGVGASLNLKIRGADVKTITEVSALKMALMPALGSIIFSMLNVGGLSFKTGMLMLGMPIAISTFIYAKELGGDENFASLNISLTTLISIISISILLILFSWH